MVFNFKIFIMKKISLKTIQNALSRDEMKVIKGGCGSACDHTIHCLTDSDCPGSCTCSGIDVKYCG